MQCIKLTIVLLAHVNLKLHGLHRIDPNEYILTFWAFHI
jgi:hypothetical protein